ncbi:GNAT family N-acetyltransferase [Paenibacillus sp. N3/727]|uniref:GNAT family N-acetyltransferase n=1 Tax=Paenibacillus sp. N3/727 TaxID=2925845 RepID=UPI001F539599|nr:GNAT family N-acetyltransferase [Paenibacillus sp. N3/727]UNK20646.1 GNAT family N-acetyltransferase [Paenibacillus sp. N3/727]
MMYNFKPMTKHMAEMIMTWEYPAPYDFYNFDSSDESMEELMNGEYYGAFDHQNQLAGFFCCGNSARLPGGYDAGIYVEENRLDIGLGMKPSLTGNGQGSLFVADGLQFMKERYKQDLFRLAVATFNTRAINVYKKNGFVERDTLLSKVHGTDVQFLCMET